MIGLRALAIVFAAAVIACAPAVGAQQLPALRPVAGAGASTDRTEARDDAQRRASVPLTRAPIDTERYEAAYAELAADGAGRTDLTPFAGPLANWPVTGQITSPFGPRWGGFHTGLDIAVPMYTPVRAAAPGQVIYAGQPYLAYGDTAVIVAVAHGSNFATLYVHLDATRPPVVSPGQHITAGTIVGYVGLTGFTTGPHLHFMTVNAGRMVDPRQYLP